MWKKEIKSHLSQCPSIHLHKLAATTEIVQGCQLGTHLVFIYDTRLLPPYF